MAEKTTVNISTVTILKVVLIGLSLWFLFAVKAIVLLFIISVIISSAMDPLVDFFYKRRIPRSLSVLLVYAAFIGLFVLIGSLLIPPIAQQFQDISQRDFYETFNSKVGSFRHNLDQLGIGKTIESNFKEFAGHLSGTLFQTTKGIVTGFVSVLTVLVVSFYLTVEENGMKNFIRHLTPYKHQAYAMTLVTKVQYKMGAWLLGQLILSTIIFGVTFISLTILKVDFALALALIAGLLEIIPVLGPFIAAVPAVFFAFLQNPPLAIAVIILYVVIQQLENHIVVPVVMSRSVGLNPVMVILGILVGGSLAGIVGALIAVPLLAGAAVFVTDMMHDGELMPDKTVD